MVPEPKSPLKHARQLYKTGAADEAGEVLRNALRRNLLSPDEIGKAGRLLRQHADVHAPSLSVLLLGQCTTTWLCDALVAEAWARGVALTVAEGEYDNVMQEILTRDPTQAPDAVILLPWNTRLLSASEEETPQRIKDEITFWQQCQQQIRDRLGPRILQVGYDWTQPGAAGYACSGIASGALARIRQVNDALRAHLPAGAYYLDLEAVAGMAGREQFYENRRYYWTKQPFSETGVVDLCRHLWAGLRALTTGPKKVLVLDLDNTLWGGIVGETGPLDIALGDDPEGEAYRAMQQYARDLSRRGIVLAIASKNNLADAKEPFEINTGMKLKLDDIAAFEACWEPKSVMLARIAERLRLGLDSFVFVDDNPAECEEIRQALPQVEVVELPPDPANYVSASARGLWFETVAIGEADRTRTAQYQAESKRESLRTEVPSLESYLESLQMRGTVRPVDDSNMQRVVQLLGKTNQFNLTTRRHTESEVRALLAQPGAIGRCLDLRDRFGDYGLVGVALCVPVADAPTPTLHLDTFLLSCRVINRTAEAFLFAAILECARARRIHTLTAEYCPTPKNTVVRTLFDEWEMKLLHETADGHRSYQLPLAQATVPSTFVTKAE